MDWIKWIVITFAFGTLLYLGTGCETSRTTVVERGYVTETEMLVE